MRVCICVYVCVFVRVCMCVYTCVYLCEWVAECVWINVARRHNSSKITNASNGLNRIDYNNELTVITFRIRLLSGKIIFR